MQVYHLIYIIYISSRGRPYVQLCLLAPTEDQITFELQYRFRVPRSSIRHIAAMTTPSTDLTAANLTFFKNLAAKYDTHP